MLAGGHLLIEDLPGVGKTTLAHALAISMGLKFSRVQFTSDLLPADVIGVTVFERGHGTGDAAAGRFVFHQGPIFSQVLLADEVNRATPKTQSALLEAMEEGQVSVDGTTRPLPERMETLLSWNYRPLQAAEIIAREIETRWMKRRTALSGLIGARVHAGTDSV